MRHESDPRRVAYSTAMCTRLYRYRAYRYLPITVIVGALVIGPAWIVAWALIQALYSLLPI